MSSAKRGYAAGVVVVLMLVLLAGLALTGRAPGLPPLHFEAKGILAAPPQAIVRVEIRAGPARLAVRRNDAQGWRFERPAAGPLPSELGSHVNTALQLMHGSAPTRVLEPAAYAGADFGDFGLSPPAYLVALAAADGTTTTAEFGVLNPAGTSQYVRLVGQPKLYLLPRFVGAEWQLTADMAQRSLPAEAADQPGASARSSEFLVPASLDQVWAVEIVFAGKLHRFERDAAGNWFLHVGQHTHTANSNVHVADPAQARIIAAQLAAFDDTQVEALIARDLRDGELDKYGLSRPPLIVMFYPRDSSAPIARIEIGNTAADGFARYARLFGKPGVVTIAGYQAGRLTALLKAVGAAS